MLASLGDPRPEVLTVAAMEWCTVLAGPFRMGGDEGSREALHAVELPEFRISKHPVTNAQFAEFVKASGYSAPRFWSEAREAGVWSEDGFKARWESELATGPRERGLDFFRAPSESEQCVTHV